MSQFATDFGAAGFEQLADVFGETATFTPRGGSARSIVVIAHRRSRVSGTGQPGGNVIDVWALIDDTDGIAESELKLGGAKLSIPERIGGTATAYNLRDLIEQDHGMWHFELDVNG